MKAPETIHSSTVCAFLAGCQHNGVDPADILKKIGFSADILTDTELRFPANKLGELILAISHTLQDETLGFMNRPTDTGGLEMSIHAMISAQTLLEVVQRYIAYWGLLHTDSVSSIEVLGDEVHVILNFFGDKAIDRSRFITWTLFMCVRVCSWMVKKPLLLDRMLFTFDEPEDLAEYHDMFSTQFYSNQKVNSLVFNKRFLDLPVLQTPENVPAFVKILPHLMTLSRVDDSLSGKIRRMLQSAENIDALPLKTIAEHLNTSQDTVRRHLNKEGSSYTEIKESVRRDLAIYHLQRKATPISEIAFLLGFSEPSAFNRAFKKWTGTTPGDCRRAAL